MEVILAILLVLAVSALLYVVKHNAMEREKNWSMFVNNNGPSSIPPAPRELTEQQQAVLSSFERDKDYWEKRQRDNTSGIMVTNMTKDQMDEYLSKAPASMTDQELDRIAAMNPEEVIWLDEERWFDPKMCEVYPSKSLCGPELYMTTKGTWIQKTSSDTYAVIDKHEAYRFLEANDYREMARSIAPSSRKEL